MWNNGQDLFIKKPDEYDAFPAFLLEDFCLDLYEIKNMETVSGIDEELKHYMDQLNESRKKSILGLVKFFAAEDEVVGEPQTIEEYNREIEEAEKRIEAGDFYTHEEVKAMMNNLFK